MEKEELMKLYELADDKNDKDAQYLLGFMYLYGQKIEKNYDLAFYFLEKAASNGSGIAKYRLARINEEGIGKKKDYTKAYSLYQEALKEGVIEALYFLGMLIINKKVKEKKERALYYFEEGAKVNEASCCYQLGLLYYNGELVNKDIDKAIYYYVLAADANFNDSYVKLGLIYMNDQKDYEVSKYWFQKAIDDNYYLGFYYMAILYFYGYGVKQDSNIALELLNNKEVNDYAPALYLKGIIFKVRGYQDKYITYIQKASEKGLFLATYELGKIYETKERPNLEKAYNCYLEAANNGVGLACIVLGSWYAKGDYIEKNTETAFNFYMKAASFNESSAYKEIGKLDFTDLDIEPETIISFYKIGISYDIEESAHYLGKIYEEGKIVEQDLEEAKKWYKIEQEIKEKKSL